LAATNSIMQSIHSLPTKTRFKCPIWKQE